MGRSDNVGYGWCHNPLRTRQASKIMSATPTHRGKPNCTVATAEYLQQQRNDATTVGNSLEQRNSEAQQSREKKATAKTIADEK